jgi:hypothetical protein
VETNFLGANTATTVAITLNGRTLDYIGGYGEDSDGDGLPDGYEVLATLTDPYLPDTGMTGIPDGYKDPDGDGYSNLQEMYNGTNPHHFDTPAGPQGLVADYTDGGNELTFTWQAASGPVLGYVIYVEDPTTYNWDVIATNSPTQLTYVFDNVANYVGQFGVEAIYAMGLSPINGGGGIQHPVLAQAAIAHGPAGKTYMLVSILTSNVIGFNAETFEIGESYPEVEAYFQNYVSYPTYDFFEETNIYISSTQFTNGIAVLSDSQTPPYLWPNSYPSAQLQGGASGNGAGQGASFLNVPFIDGTAQMKQNIRFLLRVANSSPFGYTVNSQNTQFPGYSSSCTYPANYVCSSYYYISFPYTGPSSHLDHFAPFEDNYFFRNFAFDATSVNMNGTYDTGFEPAYYNDGYSQYTNTQFEFPTYSYVVNSNSALIPEILSSNTTQWVGYFYGESVLGFGAYVSGSSLAMSNYVNVYGLPYISLLLTLTNGTLAALSPGNNVSGFDMTYPQAGNFYAGTAQPELQTVDYYFASPYNYEFDQYETDPMPGYQDGSFAVTNTTPLIIGSVGTRMLIAGYAKQAVLNGNPNVFAYLGQYFTNALLMSNGIVTTNSAGILSEYGEFFPTVPGQVALMTMPDPDQTNIQGTCVVDIIRLSLDANHDGIMDETYTGPDNTGGIYEFPNGVPFVFWANNDFDRWHTNLLDGVIEDDLETAAQPDCNYTVAGNRAIPCPRDLEDYARLWVSGVSNTLPKLPSGSTVTLSWGLVWNGTEYADPGSPTIDLFQAADPDGGIGYMTNLTTASNQINTNLCQYVGRLGPGSNILLNASTFSNNWAGDHYIWCGVAAGSGVLTLTISDGNGNYLAQSSQSIQIQDIKQMYERWTVGDDPNTAPGAPMSNATNATDNFSPGYPTQPFNYTYDPATDTNLDYIVYVHGWNTLSWEKDRQAETMYKRLYWQGYQGRFGSFRWPCNLLSYNPINLGNFDLGEWTAWQCGQPFESFLAGLNQQYPGKVYVLAHSLGNVVTGEALRLATAEGAGVIVNTYVASQAAISARVYDNTVPADLTNSYGINGSGLITPDSEGHYYTNGAPPYFNGIAGAANFADFYDNADSILGWWVSNQHMKPDNSYYYSTSFSQHPAGYYQQFGIHPYRNLLFPTNTYEIFARADESYSYPLGAETNIASRFSIKAPVNLFLSPFNFQDQHGLQFRSDNMTTAAYWHQLLVSFNLEQ